jgi:hypothetical protein
MTMCTPAEADVRHATNDEIIPRSTTGGTGGSIGAGNHGLEVHIKSLYQFAPRDSHRRHPFTYTCRGLLMEQNIEQETGKEDLMPRTITRRELAHRLTGGVDVSLWWDTLDDSLILEVCDTTLEASFEVVVAPDCGLDAFHHPYAYLESSNVDRHSPVPSHI